MLGLHSRTDPAWAKTALSDEMALLRDHGHIERKAAGHVITLMGQESEAGHHAFFIKLAYEHWPRDEVRARWAALADAEAAIVADIKWGPRVH